MKYGIYNKKSGKFEGDQCIVAQDGKVSFWDDSQGWDEAENQSIYEIVIDPNQSFKIAEDSEELNKRWLERIEQAI